MHAERRRSGETDWRAISLLYEALVQMRPTIGARVGRAAVIGRLSGASDGLQHLDRLDPADVLSYQPYWAVRAHLLAATGGVKDAIDAYRTAIGLSESDAVRRYLQHRLMNMIPAADVPIFR